MCAYKLCTCECWWLNAALAVLISRCVRSCRVSVQRQLCCLSSIQTDRSSLQSHTRIHTAGCFNAIGHFIVDVDHWRRETYSCNLLADVSSCGELFIQSLAGGSIIAQALFCSKLSLVARAVCNSGSARRSIADQVTAWKFWVRAKHLLSSVHNHAEQGKDVKQNIYYKFCEVKNQDMENHIYVDQDHAYKQIIDGVQKPR